MIVGLGNPGAAYAKTRHNVGFWVLEALAAEIRSHFRRQGLSLRAHGSFAGHDLTLAKPQTFMNQSGQAVGELLADVGLDPVDLHDLIVVHDDLDLDVGRIRLKARGGAGGHNGILSIIDILGNDRFARLKIGVGRPPVDMDAAEYVLQPASGADRLLLNEGVERALDATRCWISEGLPTAMNRFNRPPC
ncbi:MAG TPA: aminoacyl-tRNA hydrolase [Nitrospirales bacterium]